MICFSVFSRALMIGCAASVATLSHATLLQNGSLEGPANPNWSGWGYSASAFMNVYNNTGANGFFLPATNGNFVGVTAHNGDQFVAGAAFGSGSGHISQLLSAPLIPGEPYSVQAWLHRSTRVDLNVPATYEVYLCPSSTSLVGGVSVGLLEPNAPLAAGWVPRNITFAAPENAQALPYIWFVSRRMSNQSVGYSGLDSVSLNPGESATLSGTVSLNDFTGAVEQETVDVFVHGYGNVLMGTYEDVPLAADGSYSMEVAAFSNCTISVRGRTWIRSRSAIVSFVPNEVLSLDFTLSNGDADQSGEVDAADIDLIISKFGTTTGDAAYEANADLDGSTEVDAADIDIAIANFGATDE